MSRTHDLLPLLEKIRGTRILCVGDVMLDAFVYGDVTRISPEAPVPVLAAGRRTLAAGGAGNVAANLCGLGCAVTLVCVAGDDDASRDLETALGALSGLSCAVIRDKTRPTTQKTRFVAGAQQIMRLDEEDARPLGDAEAAAVIAACEKALAVCDGVILSDYGKGVLTAGVIAAVMKKAAARGVPVLVDPKGRDYARYRGARFVTPNRRELAEATAMPVATDADIVAAARRLVDDAGVAGVLATRSAEGMTLVDGSAAPLHLRARAREVYDVSGAGDTVVAVMAAALAAGSDAASAAHLANIAAGRVVERAGTVAIRADDLRDALADAPCGDRTIAPVLGWDAARDQVARWQARGLRVGFTNGCFDIVHQGHAVMLDRCRVACDRLVLGLNTDASVRRLKGPQRPVNAQDARARVVAALGSVDAVVLFGENEAEGDTPLELMKTLRPDMIFKGADYTPETVVGADFVQSYGGQVVLIPLEDGFSTTATIKKLGSAA